MTLWNDVNLIMPVADVCAYDLRDPKNLSRMSSLIKLLAEAASQVSQKHPMWTEIEIFSNLIRRLRLRIPCDQFLHVFQRIAHCLKNLQKVKISGIYLKLADSLLSGLKEASGLVILPSQQQLEYVLIRTQGVTRLLYETIDFCFSGFAHLLQRLNLGHLKQNFLMASASLARINLLLKAFLLEMCEIYSNLIKFKDVLKAGFWHWNTDPELPDDLLQWLGPRAEELLRVEDRSKNKLDFLNGIFKAERDTSIEVIDIDDDDDDVDEAKIHAKKNEPVDILVIPEEVDVDLGEVVQRCDVLPRIAVSHNDVSFPVSENDDIGFPVSEKDDTGTPVSQSDDIDIPASENDATIPIERDSNYKDKKRIQSLIESAKSLKTLRQILKRVHSLQKKKGSSVRINSLKNVKKTLTTLKEDILALKRIRILTTKEKNKRKKNLVEQAKKELFDEIIFEENTKKHKQQNGTATEHSSSSRHSLKPVRKFSELLKLCSYLVDALMRKKNKRLCKRLKALYRKGRQNAKFLKSAGDTVSCKRIIFKTSKKMLTLYQEFG